MPLLVESLTMATDVPIAVAAAVGVFGATAITGMGGLIAWMIREEYARTKSRSREDETSLKNSALTKELTRVTKKVTELEELLQEVQRERDYERKRAIEATRENAG